MKKRKTLSAIIMTLFLIIGCNNGGGEDPQKVFLTSIANLGKGFLDVFVTFGDMVTGAFGIKAETKKSDIGQYFIDIERTMTSVKNKLNTVVTENGNYPKVKEVVDQFITGTLDKIAKGAKTAASGATDGASIGEVVKSNAGTSVDATSVNALVKGIKEIVDLVIKDGNGQTDKTKPVDDDKKNIGKLFGGKNSDANGGAEEKHVASASASIGAVSGADILKAIAAANADAKKDGKVNEATDASSLALAKGTSTDNEDQLGDSAKKDAIIAAGISLRAMAKDGKFVVKDTAENKTEAESAKGVAASAVGKTLSTLIIAIRNTVDDGLKKINEVLATVKQEDKSAEVTNTSEATASSVSN